MQSKFHINSMLDFFRKISSTAVFILLICCSMAWIVDEWNDSRLLMRNAYTALCMEMETEEMDVDEDDPDDWDGGNDAIIGVPLSSLLQVKQLTIRTISTALQSDEQKLGLVRRYAPRHTINNQIYNLHISTMV